MSDRDKALGAVGKLSYLTNKGEVGREILGYIDSLESENATLKSRLEEAERERDAIIAEVRHGIGCYACENEKTCELMIDADECEQWTWSGSQVVGGDG